MVLCSQIKCSRQHMFLHPSLETKHTGESGRAVVRRGNIISAQRLPDLKLILTWYKFIAIPLHLFCPWETTQIESAWKLIQDYRIFFLEIVLNCCLWFRIVQIVFYLKARYSIVWKIMKYMKGIVKERY